MIQKDIAKIGDIYGGMLNSVKKNLYESKDPKTFDGEFRNKKEKDGPENADGYNKAGECEEDEEEDDVSKYLPKKKKDFKKEKEEDEEVEDSEVDEEDDVVDDTVEEDEEQILESKKIIKEKLNKHMSKSAFDKLFNKVLKENFGQPDGNDELDALGLDDSTPDSDLDDEFGGEEDLGGEEDSVTFTLDRAMAQSLIDVLQGALGDGEEEGGDDDGMDFGGDDDGMDFEEDEDGMDFEEDEETQGTKPAPDKKAAFQGKSNKVGGKANPKGSNTAKTDVTDDTKTTHAAPPITALQGKNNQVPGSVLKAKQDYFR
jgi:hypothetical protein